MTSEAVHNRVKFIVIAMQKCGNHGIIHWIGNQSKETLLHCNNDYKAVWNNVNLAKVKIRVDGDYVVEGSTITNYIFNLEEFDLKYFNEVKTKLIFKDNPTVLIFGRDPFNWLASSYRNKPDRKTRYTKLKTPWSPAFAPFLNFKSRIDTYKQHMYEVMGKTSYLKDHEFVFINYNKWFSDDGYRDSLSDKLGLLYGKKGMDWHTPGGSFLYSSFHNVSRNKDAVLERYKVFKNDKEFRDLCNDGELIHISKEVFDFFPKWED
jgi:hypothetical protein